VIHEKMQLSDLRGRSFKHFRITIKELPWSFMYTWIRNFRQSKTSKI